MSQAHLEIKKAIDLSPNWESVRYTEALIGFYGALSLAAFPSPVTISFDPVEWTFVKQDDESVSRLRKASTTFQELANLPDKLIEERIRLLTWNMICLSNDLERQEEAANLCQQILQQDLTNPSAISWALTRSYDIDLDASKTALKELLDNDSASVEHVHALLACLIAQKRIEDAIEVLEDTRTLYENEQAEAVWLLTLTQLQVLQGKPELALRKLDNCSNGKAIPGAYILAKEALARDTGDWQQLYEYLDLKSLGKQIVLYFSLDNVNLKSDQQDWKFITSNAEVLLRHFATAEILRLVAVSTFYAERYSKSLDLLDRYRHLFPQTKLPNDLRHIRVLCQHEMGILPEAINDARDLVRRSFRRKPTHACESLYVERRF